MLARSVGEPGDVGQDDDRRRLARGELGLERDVGVAALDAGRVDLGARDALLEAQERAADDEQEGERRDEDGDRTAHDRVGDALPARRPGDLDAVGDRAGSDAAARRSTASSTRWPSIPRTAGRNVSA